MSSPDEDDDEVTFWGSSFTSHRGEQSAFRRVGLRALRASGLQSGPPRGGQGEGGFREPEVSDWEREGAEASEPVLWGREGRPGSPADDQGDGMTFASQLADEAAAAFVQQLRAQDARGARRSVSPDSCTGELLSLWGGLEIGPGIGGGGRGCGSSRSRSRSRSRSALTLDSHGASSIAPHFHPGPEGGRAWSNPRRGSRSKLTTPAERQRAAIAAAAAANAAAAAAAATGPAEGLASMPSDQESSDEFGEMQMMRVSIYSKEVAPHKSSSPEAAPSLAAREDHLHVPRALLSPAPPRALGTLLERQSTGEADAHCTKKKPSVWGKARGRPSYPVPSTMAGVPRSAPRRKATQEKKGAAGSPSKMALGRIFPSWGQRVAVPPPEPATFPPISGVPLLGRSKRFGLVPSSGSGKPKHSTGAGKKSATRRSKEPEPSPGEDGDPDPKGQLLMYRPGPVCQGLFRGESSSRSYTTRGPHVVGTSQPLNPPSQEDTQPRGPSGDQEPLDHPAMPERQHQQPPGAQGCPQCVLLQREIDSLKEQLAIMESLAGKFQDL